MSKAFTKETDHEEELDEPDPLPAHVKNYMTPYGREMLEKELKFLMSDERPRIVEIVSWAAGNGDRSENGDYLYNKKRLREIDRRLRYLTKRLENVEVVDPRRQQGIEQVFFGATVTVCDVDGTDEQTYQIVGVDEANASEGRISWIAPLSRALLKAREGDVIRFASPAGLREIEVVEIRYV